MKTLMRLFILLAALILLLFPAQATAQPDYIRLHIVAESDSPSDQALKLCVRDVIREYTRPLLEDVSGPDAAWQMLREKKEELLSIARQTIDSLGADTDVSAELGVFPFPDRTYGNELVPAGNYRALRITLGQGCGRNWWCVIYPSLCLPKEADTDRPIEFYSIIWRWLMQAKEALWN